MNFKSLFKSITSWGKNLDSGYERPDHWDPAIDHQGDHQSPTRYHQLSRRKLTGSELITKIKDLGDISKTEIAIACGYVYKGQRGGSIRADFTSFYEALLNAKGISLGKGGRKLSYIATVQPNGNLLIGKAYTAMLDLQVGDEFTIRLGRKTIRLSPVGYEEEGGGLDF